jgi:hypothetical protein
MRTTRPLHWICFFLLSLILSGGLIARDQKSGSEGGKGNARVRKEARMVKMERQYKVTQSLLEGKRFVLEARFLKNRSGQRFTVPSNLNFISIDSLSATIQVGSMQRAGMNGVGGLTLQGRVKNWKLDRNPKGKNFYIFLTIQGNYDSYDVNLDVDYEGYATANLSGIRTGNITFEGNIVSLAETRIFKGISR